MLKNFARKGKASFVVGGQFGSEGKGAAAAFIAKRTAKLDARFDIITTNAGAQAGHTSTHDGQKRVVFHLPTASLIDAVAMRYNAAADQLEQLPPITYLNAGSVIDPDVLQQELTDNPEVLLGDRFAIHPLAAVITDECRDAELAVNSPQTKIASTRKGVGQAIARKVLKNGVLAKDHPFTAPFCRRLDLMRAMATGQSVLVEVPQGVSLSMNGPFYPHVTSRNCTVMQAMSDADIHPNFYGSSMLVLRTFPIRVGNIPEHGGFSGDVYPDQQETTWDEIGVEAEITTVTKRVRRVFTWSRQQALESIALTMPDVIYLTFCDYCKPYGLENIVGSLKSCCDEINRRVGGGFHPEILTQWGPTTDDVYLL